MRKQLFIERRPEGDYAIRLPKSTRASAVESTQSRAIELARALHPDSSIHVERVRNTRYGCRNKWRSPS